MVLDASLFHKSGNTYTCELSTLGLWSTPAHVILNDKKYKFERYDYHNEEVAGIYYKAQDGEKVLLIND